MFGYAARKYGAQTFLASTKIMDEKLEQGYTIYQINDDFSEEVIAIPGKGYLVEKPIFPESQTIVIRNE